MDCAHCSCVKYRHINICAIIHDNEEVTAYHKDGILYVSTIFALINIQFVRSAYDAFYWYNGAMYYTLYFSLSLCLGALLIAYYQSQSTPKWVIGALTIILALFLGGGNFVSGFGSAAILFTTIAIICIEQKKLPKFLTGVLTVYLAAFAFSILAPGNAFRELAVKEYHPTIIEAIGITISKVLDSSVTESLVSCHSPLLLWCQQ